MTPMPQGDEAFARACRQLHNIADINRSGVGACLDAFNDYPDGESARLLSQSLAYAIAQVRLLLNATTCLAIDLEMSNAAAKVES